MYINNDTRMLTGKSNFNLEQRNTQNSFNLDLQSKIESEPLFNRNRAIKISDSNYQNYLKARSFAKFKAINSDMYIKNKAEDAEQENLDKEEASKSETKSNIIVKPDGSRVLIITTQLGGVESTVSLQISKPTDLFNSETKIETESKEQINLSAADLN